MFKIEHVLMFVFYLWEMILDFPKVWEHKGITNEIK